MLGKNCIKIKYRSSFYDPLIFFPLCTYILVGLHPKRRLSIFDLVLRVLCEITPIGGRSCFHVAVNCKRTVNIARRRELFQSSRGRLFSNNQTSKSLSIIDDDADTNIFHGSCLFTEKTDVNAWVAVYLGRPTTVKSVKITSVAPACSRCSNDNSDS